MLEPSGVLWRAVDQDGSVLVILVQCRWDKAAASRFFRSLMKKTRSVPQVIVTNKLHSCIAPAFVRQGPGDPSPQAGDVPETTALLPADGGL